jgi:7-cyano-7-deazaguanine reductase
MPSIRSFGDRIIPMAKKLSQLGKKTQLSADQMAEPRAILEAFANPSPGRDYQVQFIFPEFTSLCPVTGQPDFATITVQYVPDRLCVEMKSLKLYFFAFRNRGIFYEAVVNAILDDLVAVLSPRRMTVIGQFAVRGGTAGTVTASHESRNVTARRAAAKKIPQANSK